ncbi:hypothetical protein D3C84_1152200 [compost metagenome]
MIWSLRRSRLRRALKGSSISTICTWARINGSELEVWKPPASRASLAMNEAAATTEGSSTTSGTMTSRPLIWKLLATA